MKRAQAWLSDRPWFIWGLRLSILWPLFLFWVLPTWAPLRQGMRQEAEYQRTRNRETERQNIIALKAKADELWEKAEKSGLDYGPANYFANLRTLESQSRRTHAPLGMVSLRIEQMQALMRRNCKSDPPPMMASNLEDLKRWQADPRKFTYQDISIESQGYQALRNISDEELAAQKKLLREMPLAKKVAWLWGIWLRGMVVMFFLYLLRMVERRGILETILADKMGFYKALADWPAYMFSYPENVVREVVVEAELRRIGGLFRRLNPVERLAIRRIAGAPDYAERIATLREAHSIEWQRSFVLALLATLFCLALVPRSCLKNANANEGKTTTIQAQDTRAGPSVILTQSPDNQENPDWRTTTANLPCLVLWLRQLAVKLLTDFTIRRRQEVVRAIDHVPVSILVGEHRKVRKQGEDTDEIHVVYNHRSDVCHTDVHLRWAGLGLQPG